MFETCLKRGSANVKTSMCLAVFKFILSISTTANFNNPIN